jgi:type VI secretion system secreted protein VgrG
MGDYTQSERPIALTTPLGPDALLLTSFSGHEEMSRLFTYDLEMLSEDDAIDAKKIVGKNVTFSVEFADGTPRYFNGFVSRFAYCGRNDRLSVYRAQVVPWLWFLTRKSDCRIFQDKSVPDIIKQIFSDAGFTDFETSDIGGSHQPWDYCVQYRETSFNFISRLMEHEGIFYYFRHEQGKHALVLGDQASAYKDCVDKDVQFASNLSSPESTDQLTHWEHQYEFRTGKWAQTDYNFKEPTTDLMTQVKTVVSLDGNSKYEFYDYPGTYEKKGDGDAETKIRMQEEEVPYNVVQGASMCRSFSPGGKFKIKKHHCKSEVGKGYAVLSTHHSATIGTSYLTGDLDTTYTYKNSFTCIPDSVVFRPARLTPKPVIHGSQTALVVGPSGEEIWPDKYGRVKVQFYWDRLGKKDEKSSCWIRCAQSSAGKNWGAMFIPRVGQEVVVTYLEGDPDLPLVTGIVYNADQMPAYTLPDEKTKSYVKSNSSQGGDGFNEIRFEDKKDKEQIFIHSQRNMDVRVLNDSMERILGNRHQVIGNDKDGKKVGDQCETVYQDKHLNIKRNQTEHIEGNYQLMVGNGEAENGGTVDVVVEKKASLVIGPDGCNVIVEGDRQEQVQGNQSFSVSGDRSEDVTGNLSLSVTGDRYEKVANQSLSVDMDENVKVGMNHAMEAGMNVHIKAGMTLILEAGLQISLKVGPSFIDIGPAGISIMGTPLCNINGGGAAGSGAGAKPKSPKKPKVPSKGDVKKAAPTKPEQADDSKTGHKSCP